MSVSPSTVPRRDSATPLAEQTAPITRPGRGIGRAIVIRFAAAAGAAVVCCARSSQEVGRTVELIRRVSESDSAVRA